jgi:hypothetical protein
MTWLEIKDMAQDPLGRREPFLPHVTAGPMRVWRHKNTAYAPRNIQSTVPDSGGSVMVWGVSLMTASWT